MIENFPNKHKKQKRQPVIPNVDAPEGFAVEVGVVVVVVVVVVLDVKTVVDEVGVVGG